MNKRTIYLILAGLAVILAGLACGINPLAAPAASPTPIPNTNPNPQPTLPLPATPLLPTPTPAPVLAPTDTTVPDMGTILANNGFERDKTLDSGCQTACSAYNNSAINVIADFYYTNKSFSLLYTGRDTNGLNERAQATSIGQLLAQLYPGTISSDVMAVAGDFPNHRGVSHGLAGNYLWSVSINILYNLDKTINKATIYITVTPG
jgi:hypothetical protein